MDGSNFVFVIFRSVMEGVLGNIYIVLVLFLELLENKRLFMFRGFLGDKFNRLNDIIDDLCVLWVIMKLNLNELNVFCVWYWSIFFWCFFLLK